MKAMSITAVWGLILIGLYFLFTFTFESLLAWQQQINQHLDLLR